MSDVDVQTRVSFVCESLPVGGTTTYLANLTGELRRRGLSIQILSLRQVNPLADEFTRRGVTPLLLDDGRLILEDRYHLVWHAIRRFSPDAVVAWCGSSTYEFLRYVPTGCRRIGAIHGADPRLYSDALPYLPTMDTVVAVSAIITEQLRPMRPSGQTQFIVIPPGIEMPDRRLQRDRLPVGPLRVIYVGRLHQDSKRVRALATVYAELVARQVPVEFTIAGSGPEESYLRQQIQDTTTGQRVTFLGNIPYSQVPELLAKQDVLLLVSDSEGQPLSVLEGMAQGVIPVVSDLPGGLRELVDDAVGRRVPVEDPAGYAVAIEGLHHHRLLFPSLANAAIDRIQKQFSVGAVAEQWITVLQRSTECEPITWPARFRPLRPLVHRWRWAFRPPFRTVRCIVKRLVARTIKKN